MRGLAALLVVWQHSAEKFERVPEVAAKGTLLFDLASSLDFGRIGVVCFFLISGYVIPFSFSKGESAVGKFAIRRFCRLYPVYWLSIAAVLLSSYLVAGKTYSATTIAANLTMMQTFLGQDHLLGLYWTLQVEVIFYLLCASLFAFGMLGRPLQQLRSCLLLLGFFCLLVSAAEYTPLFSGVSKELLYIPYVLSIMFCGTIIRTLMTASIPAGQRKLLLIGPIAVFAVPVLVLAFSSLDVALLAHPIKFGAAHLLGLGLFLAGMRYLKTSNPVLLWLGAISYSVYLFHPVAVSWVGWMRVQSWATQFDSLHMGFYMAAVVAVTLLISTVAYRVVERPGIELGYRLSSR